MRDFKKINDVVKYLQGQGWRGRDRSEPISKRTIYNHVKSGFLPRKKDGSFIKKDVERYAIDFLEDDVIQREKCSVKSQLSQEQLRSLQIKNGIASGELVSLPEEIKKRVAVVQGMKSAMINEKYSVIRELRDYFNQNPPDSNVLEAVALKAGELYEKMVNEVFENITSRGRA
jgi:hypothetical protein